MYFSSIYLKGFTSCVSIISLGGKVRLGIYYQNKGQKAEEATHSLHVYLALHFFILQFLSNKTPGCTEQFCTDGSAQEDLRAKTNQFIAAPTRAVAGAWALRLQCVPASNGTWLPVQREVIGSQKSSMDVTGEMPLLSSKPRTFQTGASVSFHSPRS